MKTTAKVAIIALTALSLAGCEQWIDRILDAHNPGGPAAIQPDSVRGDTTFYSYLFRGDGVQFGNYRTIIKKVQDKYWIFKDIPSYYGSDPFADAPVPNQFRLICLREDSVTSEAILQKAYAAIDRAGAIIATHGTIERAVGCDPLGADYFWVQAISGAVDGPLPSDFDLMRFVHALDDTTAFEFAYPVFPVWPCRAGRAEPAD